MAIIANNSRFFIALVIILASGCKTKVYQVNGKLGSSDYSIDSCVDHPEFSEADESIRRLKWLMKKSVSVNDIPSLEWYSDQFVKGVKVLGTVLSPTMTDSNYSAHYQWTIQKAFLPKGATLSIEAVSVNGIQMDSSVMSIDYRTEEIAFTIDRKASIFEICELSSSVQTLVAVSIDGLTQYYFRLTL